MFNKKFNVNISDINGRVIKNLDSTINNLNVDLSDIQKGIYFVSITTDEGSFVKKIIKE